MNVLLAGLAAALLAACTGTPVQPPSGRPPQGTSPGAPAPAASAVPAPPVIATVATASTRRGWVP